MSDNPFFSVIIPLYNKEPHISRGIKSVLKQTFQNFELIVINDASSDGSLEVVKTFVDPRIKVYHRDNPGPGGYAARNLGIKKATGEWLAFLDADDEWFPDHLEKMKSLSEKFPKCSFLGCGWQISNNKMLQPDKYFAKNLSRTSHEINCKQYLYAAAKGQRAACASVTCVKRDSPVAQNLFPENNKVKRGGDLHAWLKLICYHKKMAWSNHIGAVYHQDSVNMVTRTHPSSPYLMEKETYKKLSEGLNLEEKMALKNYFNIYLRNAWLVNIRMGHANFNLIKKLYWRGDCFNAIFTTLLALIPRFFWNFFIKIRDKMLN